LPVALSYFGGGGTFSSAFNCWLANIYIGYFDPASDGGLEANLASRGYRSLLVDDGYDSEEY
jgi:Niemann-Pick C1 protein